LCQGFGEFLDEAGNMSLSWFNARIRTKARPGHEGRAPVPRKDRPDPYQRFAVCCVLACALMMAVEYTVTCLWLPRQSFVQGIAGGRSAPGPGPATLSEAVRAAVSQHNAILEAAAEKARQEEARALEPAQSGGSEAVTAGLLPEEAGDEPASPDAVAGSNDAAAGNKAETCAGEGGLAAVYAGARVFSSLVVVLPPVSPDAGGQPRYPLQEEYRWLESCQLPSGAICMSPVDRRINPYFATQSAMALLTWNAEAVQRYISWYLGHLNEKDRFGLEGTVYDHYLSTTGERSERDYDAADSYAATFLSLVARYVFATGDADLVLSHLSQLERVARVCAALQDEDGLTWAKADHRYKFLMDNCEVARGLADWAELLRTIGLWSQGDAWATVAASVEQAVERELWSEQRGEYAWAKTSYGQRWTRTRWYPDTVGQLYPVVYGLVDPLGPRAQALVDRVNSAYPLWPQLKTGDAYPWCLAAYAQALAGRREQAMAFADEVWETFLVGGRPWPWYNLEGSYFILTLLELAQVGASAPARR